MEDRIRQLIRDDKTEKAIEELLPLVKGKDDDLYNDLNNHQAALAKNKKDSRRGLITSEEENKTRTRVRLAIQEMLKEIEKLLPVSMPQANVLEGGKADSIEPTIVPEKAPSVFISYNHADSKIADKLKAALEQNGIVVRIDRAVMEAGANIQEFIESSIRDTDVTLSIVSNRSLLSAWVALESIGTFYNEKFAGKKKFIACYIDDDFFRNDFRLNATKQIDAKIEEINNLIPAYIAEKIDTVDLDGQKTRLYRLRNNLGDILQRLKESLSLDIREDTFDESLAKIVSAIKGKQ